MALLLNPRQSPKQRPDQSRALGTPGKHLWIWPPLCLDPELARGVWGSDFCPSVQKKVACLTQEPSSFHPPAPTVTSLSHKTALTAAGTTAPGVRGKRGGRADEVGRDPREAGWKDRVKSQPTLEKVPQKLSADWPRTDACQWGR